MNRFTTWRGAAGAALLLATALPAAAQIEVEVNSRPVQFGAVQPARIGGRVLIPLRAVVEALGADIRWDAPTQTVHGSKGDKTFSLPIGGRSANVNGRPVALDVPAQLISGTTMVPLRFVAEALGAEVEWNAAAQQVAITSPDAEAGQPEAPGRITGEVVSVRADGDPATITIRANGVRQTYEVGADTIVLRGPEGQRGRSVDLQQVRPGDQVRLRLGARDVVEVVEAFTAAGEQPAPAPGRSTVSGQVVTIRERNGARTLVIRTDDGTRQSFEIPANAAILRSTGEGGPERVDFGDLQTRDQVRLTLNRDNQVTRVLITGAGAEAPADPDAGTISGEIVALRLRANPPSLVLRTDGQRKTYELAADAAYFRRQAPGRRVRITAEDVELGQQVRVRLDAAGTRVEQIEVLPDTQM